MSVTVDNLLIVQLANWLNDKGAEIPLPCPILVDEHEDTGQQLWIQPLAGTTIIKRYTNGDYIGQLPFAVYYQLTRPDNMTLLDVPLWALGKYLEKDTVELKDVSMSRLEMVSTPAGYYRGEDGTCVNQAVYHLLYEKGENYEQ